MRRVKHIVLWSLGLLLLSVAVIAVFLAIAGDGFYRWAAEKLVEGAIDRDIHMDGTFSFHIGLEPTLVVTDVWIDNAPWAEKREMGRVKHIEVQLALRPLLSGIVLLPRLVVEGLTLDLETGPDGKGNWEVTKASDKGEDTTGRKDPFLPLVELISLKDMAITYTDRQSERDTEIVLHSLQTERSPQDAHLTMQGKGRIKQDAFRLTGRFGTIEAALAATAPYPLELQLEALGLVAELNGTVQNLPRAEGVDIRLTVRAPSLGQVLEVLETDLTLAGSATGSARLTGNLDSLAVNDLVLEVVESSGQKLHVEGSLADLLNRPGLDLRFSGHLGPQALRVKPDLVRGLPQNLRDVLDGATRLEIAGRITGDLKTPAFETLKAHLEHRSGAALALQGHVAWDVSEGGMALTGLDATSHLSLPGPGLLEQALGTQLPDLGAIRAASELSWAQDSITLRSFTVQAASFDALQLSAKGRIGKLSGTGLDFELDPQLEVSASVQQSRPLIALFTEPAKETQDADADVVRLIQQALQAVGLHPGPADGKMGPHTRAAIEAYQAKHGLAVNGRATPDLLRHLQRASLSTPEETRDADGDVVRLIQQELQAVGLHPGLVDGKMGPHTRAAIEAYQAQHGLAVNGRATPDLLQHLQRELGLDRQQAAPAPGHTRSHTSRPGASLPELGPVMASGRLSGREGAYRLDHLRLTLGAQDAPVVEASGTVGSLRPAHDTPVNDLALKVRVVLPSIKLVDASFPDVGAVSVRAQLQGSSARATLDIEDLTAGETASLLLTAKGSIDIGKTRHGLGMVSSDLRVQAESASTKRMAGLFEQEAPELGEFSGRFRLHGNLSQLGVADIDARVQHGDDWRLQASGSVAQVFPLAASGLQGVEIALDAQARSTASVARALAVSLPDLGAVTARGRLSDRDGSLGLDGLQLEVTKVGYLSLHATGALGDVLRGEQLDVTLALNAPAPRKVAALFEADIGPVSPLQGTGRLRGGRDKATLKATLTIGQTRLSADVTGDLSGARPSIEGAIEIPDLYLRDIGIVPEPEPAGEEPHTASTSKPRAAWFSKEPLDTSALRAVDVALVVRIDEITGNGLSIDTARLTLRLDDGNLRLHPAKLVYAGGQVTIDVGLDATNPPQTFVKATGNDIMIGAVLEQFKTVVPVKGKFLNVAVDLKSHGLSPDQWAANVTGRFGLVGEDLQVLRTHLDLLSVDVLRWSMHKLLPGKKYAKLDCTIARITAKNGTLTIDELFSQGSHFKLRGSGTVDLNSKTLDVTLHPKKRYKFPGTEVPVIIKGDLASPSVRVAPRKIAASIALGAIFGPEVRLPLEGLDYLREYVAHRPHSPCLKGEKWGRAHE